jgi:hypothetical protein
MGYRLASAALLHQQNWSTQTATVEQFRPVLLQCSICSTPLRGRETGACGARLVSRVSTHHPAAEGRTSPPACRPSARLTPSIPSIAVDVVAAALRVFASSGVDIGDGVDWWNQRPRAPIRPSHI